MQRNKEFNPERKKHIRYNIVGGVIGILLSLFIAYLSYYKYKDALIDKTVKESLHFFLLDGFSFGFIFYMCFFLFAWISYKQHFFSLFKFTFKKFGTALLPRRMKTNENMPKTYGDYLEELNAKPVPYYKWFLWDSLVLLGIAIIFGIIYIINPVTVDLTY